ncbi:MAG: CoB--CoM heterodisulfide reductase iron-sulfur subunit B family protein [Syntrophales bacterium]
MKVSYYPGCSLHGTGKEFDLSVRAVSGALGVELKEIDDWSCCGASSAHATNFKLSLALPARDLMRAEKDGIRDMMVPCAACFSRLKTSQHHMDKDASLKQEVEEIVGDAYQGTMAVRNAIDVFHNLVGTQAIKGRVRKPLTGLKPVSYYGCLLLRPPKVCEFEDPENPVLLDHIMNTLGAESCKWSYKTDCCGGSLTLSKTKVVVKLVDRMMTMALEAGANCVVAACPVCMANLDMRASESLRLPVFYFTELMALAMGLEGPESWFKKHCVDPRPLLIGLGLV